MTATGSVRAWGELAVGRREGNGGGPASDGMPGDVQLVGPYHEELPLLVTAAWCEKVIGFDAAPHVGRFA